MVLESPFPNAEIPEIGFNDYIFNVIDRQADEEKIALIDCDNEANFLTIKHLKTLSLQFAKGIHTLGIRNGDVIATCISNSIELSFITLGTMSCGAILTTCNPNYTKDEILKQFNDSQPRAVFVDESNYEKVSAVKKQLRCIEHIFSIEPMAVCESVYDLLRKSFHGSRTLFSPHKNQPDGTCVLLYSSGTTGLPKGVMLSHRNWISIIQTMRVALHMTPLETVSLVLPTFHVFGLATMFLGIASGSTVVVQKRFTVEGFFHSVEKYKVTFSLCVPPMILAIYNSPALKNHDISSLKRIVCGAAPLPDGVASLVKKKLSVHVFQGWGTTEAMPLTTGDSSNEAIPISSTGLVSPNTQLKVVDPNTGKELGPNQDGELCAKGPQVMRGYYKNPSATKLSFDDDGWYRTGDLGHYDKRGLVFIVDRLKELIKYKGFQVAPAELEELLLHHPGIADAAVIGVSDQVAGEVPKAFVVKKDPSLTANDIHDFVKGKISSYKYLRGGIIFRSAIPKSPSGKILRRELRALEIKSKI